jgi:hypothetical protein
VLAFHVIGFLNAAACFHRSGVFTMFSILDGCMYQSQQALLGKQD